MTDLSPSLIYPGITCVQADCDDNYPGAPRWAFNGGGTDTNLGVAFLPAGSLEFHGWLQTVYVGRFTPGAGGHIIFDTTATIPGTAISSWPFGTQIGATADFTIAAGTGSGTFRLERTISICGATVAPLVHFQIVEWKLTAITDVGDHCCEGVNIYTNPLVAGVAVIDPTIDLDIGTSIVTTGAVTGTVRSITTMHYGGRG